MVLGISKQEEEIIRQILFDYKPSYEFWAYGSRVKGNYSSSSDLDVLIKGEQEVSVDVLDELKQKFDDSLLPYIVNFSDFYKIDHHFYLQIYPDLILL